MRSLDTNNLRSSVTRLISELPLEKVREMEYDSGFSGDMLIDSIVNEFSLAAHEEEFEPYLVKGTLRTAPISRMLPEHARDSLIRDHLGSTDLTTNQQTDIPKENEKMTIHDNGPKQGYEPVRKFLRNKNYEVASDLKMDREQQLIEELEALRNGNVGADLPASAYSGEEMQHIISALHAAKSPHSLNGQQIATNAVNNNAFLDAFKHVGTTIGGQLKGAVTAEVSARINRALVGYARQAFPQLPQGPMADTVLGFAIPSILLLVAHSVREAGPESIGISRQITDGVETTAKAALSGVSRDAIKTAVDQAVPMLSFVAAMSSGNIPDQLSDGQEV